VAPIPRHVAMTWAQRLKRVFRIEIERCEHCGGAVKIIACVQNRLAIAKILTHLREASGAQSSMTSPPGAANTARGVSLKPRRTRRGHLLPGAAKTSKIGDRGRLSSVPETLLRSIVAGFQAGRLDSVAEDRRGIRRLMAFKLTILPAAVFFMICFRRPRPRN
jgi:hypothetical protein